MTNEFTVGGSEPTLDDVEVGDTVRTHVRSLGIGEHVGEVLGVGTDYISVEVMHGLFEAYRVTDDEQLLEVLD